MTRTDRIARRLTAASDPDLGYRFHQQCRKTTEKFRSGAIPLVSFTYSAANGLDYSISIPSLSGKTFTQTGETLRRLLARMAAAEAEWNSLVKNKKGLNLPGLVKGS